MPLAEVAGNAGRAVPAQIVRAFPKLKDERVSGVTVTCRLNAVAHWPADGVNV